MADPQPINWLRLATDLQRHLADLVHRDDQPRYGDEFYAEALRRTLGYRPPDEDAPQETRRETVSPGTGLVTIADHQYTLDSHTIVDRMRAEQAEADLKAEHDRGRADQAKLRRGLAAWLRADHVTNERTVPSAYRRQGVHLAARWLDPDDPANPYTTGERQ